MMERIERMRVSDDALDLVFRKARTHNAWFPKPVPDELLRQLYDTLKWGLSVAKIKSGPEFSNLATGPSTHNRQPAV
jgi:nitroreductase